jgi:hypothetical protein
MKPMDATARFQALTVKHALADTRTDAEPALS